MAFFSLIGTFLQNVRATPDMRKRWWPSGAFWDCRI